LPGGRSAGECEAGAQPSVKCWVMAKSYEPSTRVVAATSVLAMESLEGFGVPK